MASGSALGRRMSVDGGAWEVGDGLKLRFNVQREADCCWKSEMPFTPRFEGEASRGLGNVEAARCRLGLPGRTLSRAQDEEGILHQGNESQQSSADSPRSGGDLPPEPWTNNANTKHNFNISTAQVQVSQGINPTQGLHKSQSDPREEDGPAPLPPRGSIQGRHRLGRDFGAVGRQALYRKRHSGP